MELLNMKDEEAHHCGLPQIHPKYHDCCQVQSIKIVTHKRLRRHGVWLLLVLPGFFKINFYVLSNFSFWY